MAELKVTVAPPLAPKRIPFTSSAVNCNVPALFLIGKEVSLSFGSVTVLRFKAVTWPVVLVVTLSTAVNVPPSTGLAVDVVSVLVVSSWSIFNVSVAETSVVI